MKNPLTRITKKNSWKILAVMILSLIIIELLYIAAIFKSGTIIVTEHKGKGDDYGLPSFSSFVGADYRFYAVFNKGTNRIPIWQVNLFKKYASAKSEQISENIYITDKLVELEQDVLYQNGYIYEDGNNRKLVLSIKPDERITSKDIDKIVEVYRTEMNSKLKYYDYDIEESRSVIYHIEKYQDRMIIGRYNRVYYVKDDTLYKVYDDMNNNYHYFDSIIR